MNLMALLEALGTYFDYLTEQAGLYGTLRIMVPTEFNVHTQ